MRKSLRIAGLELGVCYYPEHWPESLWADDYRRMRELGLEIVRIGEFAWSIFEPEEGRFEFELFDRAMDLAQQHELRVILGTPTATPPAWLTHKYPEVLNATRAGVVFQHGQRRHYNYNAPIYRELSHRIATQMASHYASHPALLGWQIDNELNCEISDFYSEADDKAFREWLKRKYGTLDTLNFVWGAVFWNQTYSDWEQVHLSRPTPSDSPNPHQMLDEKRFVSDSTIAFAKLQADAIRAHDKQHFITTNGLFGHLDSHRMTEEALDFISFDSYPNFELVNAKHTEDALRDRVFGLLHAAVRDISPQFCVMEQQSGAGGWVNRMQQPSPRPGQLRLWTLQSVAHGADRVLYFRWRTAPFGTEIYWHGINDYDNRPNRRCAEVAQVAKELETIAEVAGAACRADVAILQDYDNSWDGEFDGWHGPYKHQSAVAWYTALQYRHAPADVVTVRAELKLEDLAKYKALIYPHPTILTEETASLLQRYVADGGHLVFGARTGYKDINGHCPMRPMPGPVAELCGVTVEEFTRIAENGVEPLLDWVDARRGSLRSGGFNDVLHVESADAEVLATYAEDAGHYAGKPALVRNHWGSGSAYYYGGVFNVATAQAMADVLGIECPLKNLLDLPREVELAIRETEDGKQFIFLLNYTSTPQTICVRGKAIDLLSGDLIDTERSIPPYGVLVLQSQK